MSKTKVHGKEAKVIAILTADWHLSHKPPVWRSAEPDWYEAMRRPLGEIEQLAAKHHGCPILVAGDIFDKWNSPAELINFAMKYIPPNVYAIPGQHDIPNHNIQELHKSAFASMTLANIIQRADPIANTVLSTYAHINCFPYGKDLKKCEYRDTALRIAIIHKYFCIPNSDYQGAPKEVYVDKKLVTKNHKWYDYDVIVAGDNHRGFLFNVGDTLFWNCGTLMRRKSDEEDYKPRVGLLYSDGHVEPHYLDISKDKHLMKEEAEQFKSVEEINMAEFAKELKKLGSSAMDFAKAIKEFWQSNKTKKAVQDIITKAMEHE